MRILMLLLLLLGLSLPSVVHSAERKLAVIVGVGTYRGGSGLDSLGKAPINDARSLAEVLRKQGYTVYEMTHEVARQEGQELMAPNIAYIRDRIDGVLDYPNLGRGDAVIISLHGHGVQFDHVAPNGQKTPQFYFCPADATIDKLQTANDITERNHLLPLDELYSRLNECTAATKLLIVDACRNDPSRPGLKRSGLASSTLPKLPPPPGGIAAFFSCKPNQFAFQNTDEGYGYFTRYLVEGLSGKADLPLANRPADGIITFAELSAYVANNTYAEVYELYKEKQSPELRGELDLNLPLARVTPVPMQPAPSAPPSAPPAADLQPFTNSLGMKLVPISAGEFTMGSNDGDDDEKPAHRVRISRPFYLQSTVVTQSQWKALMGTEPWKGQDYVKEGSNYPATYVSWEDAVAFCKKLSQREGKTYRLPTEAEWEYACRAGTTTKYSFGDDASQLGQYAWYDENAWDIIDEKYAHEVGRKRPNPWGLYDMHGNVWEWCSDWYAEDYYASSPVSDPQGPSGGSYRVFRGGCWVSTARRCRSANRSWFEPSFRDVLLGFRLALSPSGD